MTYYVDEGMLGTEWRGSTADLREFCEALRGACEAAGIDVDIQIGSSAANTPHARSVMNYGPGAEAWELACRTNESWWR